MADWFSENLVSILNGFAIGSLLFILAVGLSIVFGMMGVLNLAHGAFYLVGTYLAYSLLDDGVTWGGFLGALALATVFGLVAGGALSVMTEPLAKRPILDQALLTLGVSLIIAEVLSIIYGNDVYSIAPPPGLDDRVDVGDGSIPVYRLALIGVGLVLALAVWLIVEKTSVGALVRASVADREMVSAMGIDNRKVKVAVLGIGSALAMVAGVLGTPVYGVDPGLDESVLLLALIVVVIGGLGSVKGALIGALVIGQVDSLGRALLPELASFILFGALAVVLVVRPRGLFGPRKVPS
ncbi:branched-chain amino acid ABC transporter permease [Blastococcus sp. SYSU D00868]